MQICVFSFNRGIHLKNCIESIEACIPSAKISVYDDNSNDARTRAVLADIAKTHRVFANGLSGGEMIKCGGLYNNMQLAIENHTGTEPLCFVQDDMQIVRPVDEKDLKEINAFFERNPEAAFLHPAFLKGRNRNRDSSQTYWDPKKGAYFRHDDSRSVGVYFSAVSILRPDRLLAKGWKFENKEKLNELLAKNTLGKMGLMRNPFLIWLPNVPAFRGKHKTLGLKLAELKRRSGFYPMAYLSNKATDQFKTRDASKLPIAEDFLAFRQKTMPKPWRHHPLEGAPLLKLLNKIELNARRHLSSKKTFNSSDR